VLVDSPPRCARARVSDLLFDTRSSGRAQDVVLPPFLAYDASLAPSRAAARRHSARLETSPSPPPRPLSTGRSHWVCFYDTMVSDAAHDALTAAPLRRGGQRGPCRAPSHPSLPTKRGDVALRLPLRRLRRAGPCAGRVAPPIWTDVRDLAAPARRFYRRRLTPASYKTAAVVSRRPRGEPTSRRRAFAQLVGPSAETTRRHRPPLTVEGFETVRSGVLFVLRLIAASSLHFRFFSLLFSPLIPFSSSSFSFLPLLVPPSCLARMWLNSLFRASSSAPVGRPSSSSPGHLGVRGGAGSGTNATLHRLQFDVDPRHPRPRKTP